MKTSEYQMHLLTHSVFCAQKMQLSTFFLHDHSGLYSVLHLLWTAWV